MDRKNSRITQRLNTIDPEYFETICALIAEIDAVKKGWFLVQRFYPQTVACLTPSIRRPPTGFNRIEIYSIFDPTPPYLVPKEMHELIDWHEWALENKIKHPLILLANFIFEFLAIHPFQDGNGRTSRLLSNLMLLQNEYHFTTLVSHEKSFYGANYKMIT